MALDATSFEASTSEHLCRPGICSTFQEFHLNEKPVVASLRPRSSSTSTASSNDLSRVGKCPRRWDESILHLLGDLEGTQLFKRHLEHLQLGHCHKFYHFCDNFKKRVEESAPTVKLRKMINLAYENYIEAGKNLHIQCLDSDVRAAIARRMAEDKIEITMFDAAQKQVLDFLQQTSYMSFFESESYLKSDVYLDFKDYMNDHFYAGMPEKSLDPEEFQKKFTRFLFGSVGSKHRLLLGFEDDITCGEPAPKMTVLTSRKSNIQYKL